jgi:hypothetical protein
MKVAIFATIVCCSIILPLNMTAPCHPEKSGLETCKNITQLDSYAATTLANIPPMVFLQDDEVPSNSTETGGFRLEPFFQNLNRYFHNDSGITPRLITIVAVAWSIYIYTCCE